MHDRTRMKLEDVIAPLSFEEKRRFLAKVVRSKDGSFSDGDKLDAIELDNELAGHGSKAKLQKALATVLADLPKGDAERVMSVFREFKGGGFAG